MLRFEMTETGVYDVFLSYNSRDHAVVERVAIWLRQRGLKPFLDRWYLIPGKPWPLVLENLLVNCGAVALFVGPGEMGPWQQRERSLALSIQTQRPSFSAIPVLLPGCEPAIGFLSQNTWIDLRHGVDDPVALENLARAIVGQPSGSGLDTAARSERAALCPFRGLLYFREQDAAFFFGRATAIQTLVTAVEQHRMIAVVGASGSGKSSVVRAGLLPRLRRLRQPTREILCFFPGDDPFARLASALLPVLEPDMTETSRLIETERLATALRERELSLRRVAERLLSKQSGTDRLMIVIDQWEELYTLTHSQAVRLSFVETMLDATRNDQVLPIEVVLTLRGDFLSDVLSHRRLADALQGAQINLGPMTRSELTKVVLEPARCVGLDFEHGLPERLLDDVGEEPGNLPLLEFVLGRLWEDRRAETLTHEAYDAMGRLQGAIAKSAESVYEKLSPLEQHATRGIFLSVVRPGPAGEDTRRRARMREILDPARDLAKRLVDHRLLVTAVDGVGEQTIEISHEVLIRQWERLRGWINTDREFLFWRDRFRGQLEERRRKPNDEGTILLGAALAEAERWLGERGEDLSPEEHAFIHQSVTKRNEAQQLERKRHKRELVQARDLARAQAKRLEAQRRAARWLQVALASITVGAVLVSLLAVQFNAARKRAEELRQNADELIAFMLGNEVNKFITDASVEAKGDLIRMVDNYFKKLGPRDNLQLRAAAAARKAEFLMATGRYREALSSLQGATDAFRRVAQNAPEDITAVSNLGFLLGETANALEREGKYDKALTAAEETRRVRERLVQMAPTRLDLQLSLAFARNEEGKLLKQVGRAGEALTAARLVQATFKRLVDKEPRNEIYLDHFMASLSMLAGSLNEQRKPDEALVALHESTMIARTLSNRHPDDLKRQFRLLVLLNKEGELLLARNEIAEALGAFWESRTITEQLAEIEPENAEWQNELFFSRLELGDTFVKLGNLSSALEQFLEAQDIVERLVLRNPNETRLCANKMLIHIRIGGVLTAQQRSRDARAAYEKAEDIGKTLLAEAPTDTVLRNDVENVRTHLRELNAK